MSLAIHASSKCAFKRTRYHATLFVASSRGRGLSYLRKTWERSMVKASSLKTKVSTKGQVILPKAIRDKRDFGPGAELIVEELQEGVLLRPSTKAGATRVEDVFGMLGPVDQSCRSRR